MHVTIFQNACGTDTAFASDMVGLHQVDFMCCDPTDAQRTPLLGLEPALGGLPDLERGLMRILHCTRYCPPFCCSTQTLYVPSAQAAHAV